MRAGNRARMAGQREWGVLLCLIIWGTAALYEPHNPRNRIPGDYRGHPCDRPCQDGGAPMTCRYEFVLEAYWTLSRACLDCPLNASHCSLPHCVPADGVSRAILVVNRRLPGPGLFMCEGDTVEVEVRNKLLGAGTTLHWHGHLQHGSQFMDGVGMVTQCPIPAHTSFTYRFRPSPGTHFWHSHTALQRSSGVFGHFVVRRPPSLEPHRHLYDLDLSEHAIVLTDWFVKNSESKFVHHHHDDGDNKPHSILINGKGVMERFRHPETGEEVTTPREVLRVTAGKRYRLRIVSNGVLNCPLRFSIDGHRLLVIASDGSSVDPVEVDALNLFAGERFDVVLTADRKPNSYWVRVSGLADCGAKFKSAHQEAVLLYQGAPRSSALGPVSHALGLKANKMLNPLNRKSDSSHMAVMELNATYSDERALKEIPDKKFYLAMDAYHVDNDHFHHAHLYPTSRFAVPWLLLTPQINHISLALPPAPPLSQWDQLDEELFCNAETVGRNCSAPHYCECVHRLQVGLGEVVEFVLIDEGVPFNANHPTHLHGHHFHVVAMDRVGSSTSLEEVRRLDQEGKIHRKLTRAPLKDTVTVPDGGYTVVRFLADNPGFWLLHCHIEFHAEIGMALIVQVGDVEDMPPRPPGFPTCGDWRPPDEEESRVVSRPLRDTPPSSTPSLGASLPAVVLASLLSWLCLQQQW